MIGKSGFLVVAFLQQVAGPHIMQGMKDIALYFLVGSVKAVQNILYLLPL